jgi:mRNA interferase MazF
VKVRRGDIVIVDLSPTKGSEQQGTNRPCVVIQTDVRNRNSPTTIIAAFTKQYNPNNTYPFEVDALASNTALSQDSVADLSQIRVVDVNKRVKTHIGSVASSRIEKIDTAIKTASACHRSVESVAEGPPTDFTEFQGECPRVESDNL